MMDKCILTCRRCNGLFETDYVAVGALAHICLLCQVGMKNNWVFKVDNFYYNLEMEVGK